MYTSGSVNIKKHEKPLKGTVRLPSSKSISNRLLIINALSNNKVVINNLSNANDTQVLKRRLLSDSKIIDVGDAGTAMRFMTAYLSVKKKDTSIQGSERMHERPIGALVRALREIGGDIDYMNHEGYPPLKFKGFEQRNREVAVPGNISSQFITALLLIAPELPMGLRIKVEGKFMSRSYVEMTIRLLERCGIDVHYDDDIIEINNQNFQPTMISVESDWSSASYWFALVSLIPGSDIVLPALQEDSFQGDAQIIDIAEKWGVRAEFTPVGLRLTQMDYRVDEQIIDFSNIPDLAQTVAVVHALKGIKGKYIGLESLRIKETDRISALQNELAKLNAELSEEGDYWVLKPSKNLPKKVTISTYQDHRMAMAFSALAAKMDVVIENRDVTKKSYPHFWEDLIAVDMDLT